MERESRTVYSNWGKTLFQQEEEREKAAAREQIKQFANQQRLEWFRRTDPEGFAAWDTNLRTQRRNIAAKLAGSELSNRKRARLMFESDNLSRKLGEGRPFATTSRTSAFVRSKH